MENEEQKFNNTEIRNQDKEIINTQHDITKRSIRLEEIDRELLGFKGDDNKNIEQIEIQRNHEFESKMNQMGVAEIPISEETKGLIHQNMVSNSIEHAKKENERFDDIQREKKIIEYLNESLPETEDRIGEPMNKNCNVAVVIPCYGERDHILDTLQALAEQKNMKSEEFEVITVINNSKEEPFRRVSETEEIYNKRVDLYRKAVEDNQKTLDLINIINKKLNIEPEEFSEEDLKKILAIKSSGLRVFAIDKATADKALPSEKANVGYARNRGVAEVVARFYEQLNKNGIIVQTDGDTKLDEKYLSTIVRTFNDDHELIAGSSMAVKFIPSEVQGESLNSLEKSKFNKIQLYDSLLRKYIKRKVGMSDDFKEGGNLANVPLYFSGCNMASRAFESAIVGGIPQISGGEDTEFGIRLCEIGKVNILPKEAKVYSADRLSLRASTGAGARKYRILSSVGNEGEIKVKIPPSVDKLEEWKNILEPLNGKVAAHEKISKEFIEKLLKDLQFEADDVVINIIDHLLKNGAREMAFEEIMLMAEKGLSIMSLEMAAQDLSEKFILEYEIGKKIFNDKTEELLVAQKISADLYLESAGKIFDIVFGYGKNKVVNVRDVELLLSEHKEEFDQFIVDTLNSNNKKGVIDFIFEASKKASKEDAIHFTKEVLGVLNEPSKDSPLLKLDVLHYLIP